MPAAPCPQTVLVVEDEASLRLLVVSILEAAGYTILEAEDGSEAIHVLDQYQPPSDSLCAILLDMMLPGTDGFGVLRHLDQLGDRVPVVAMSGSSSHLAAATAAGVNATLTKPFTLEQLLGLVRQFCGEAAA
jgi:CheY-like chemotaxis protein